MEINGNLSVEDNSMGEYKGYADKEKRKDYVSSWDKENRVRVTLNIKKSKDSDILEWLESKPNKSDYVIALIRKDMEANK